MIYSSLTCNQDSMENELAEFVEFELACAEVTTALEQAMGSGPRAEITRVTK